MRRARKRRLYVRAMRVFAAVAAIMFLVVATGSAAAVGPAAPPSGLSPQGLRTWNLEALLHDTFGTQDVYLRTWGDYPPPWGKSRHRSWDFGTTFIGNCCSGDWIFTFANASGSNYRLARPRVPPRPTIGASGGTMPLSIQGRYISCGTGRWLWTHSGGGPPNFQLDCGPKS